MDSNNVKQEKNTLSTSHPDESENDQWLFQWPMTMDFPGGSAGKEFPAMQETPGSFLGWEVALEKV